MNGLAELIKRYAPEQTGVSIQVDNRRVCLYPLDNPNGVQGTPWIIHRAHRGWVVSRWNGSDRHEYATKREALDAARTICRG